MAVCVVCCTERTKGKSQDSQNKETNTDKVQRAKNEKRSKARVCSRSPAEIVGSNLAGGMDVCVVQYRQQHNQDKERSTEK
jgi:hypothetical protein